MPCRAGHTGSMISDDENPGTILSEAESWRLLEHCDHGRIALSVSDEPDIFPINFLAHDGVLLLRTNPGMKVAELTVNHKVAFEADGISSDEAWSVVVKGTARVIDSQSEIDRMDQLPLKPWIPTLKYTYVEITPKSVSGRHFDLGREPDRY
jgi:uncharacterized protein